MAGFFVQILGVKPLTQPRVVNFRLAIPEVGSESAFNPQMIQLQFDGRHSSGEIALHVVDADIESRNSAPVVLSFDNHSLSPVDTTAISAGLASPPRQDPYRLRKAVGRTSNWQLTVSSVTKWLSGRMNVPGYDPPGL